jgi:hypothetical protein
MPVYRLYTIDPDGHISAPAAVLDFEREQEALEAAKTQADAHNVELWDGPRQIAKFSPD